MNSTFKTDLQLGEEAELRFIELVKHKFQHITKIPGRFKWFDLIGIKEDGSTVTFEVKTDVMAKQTGNIAIETSSNSEASGVIATQADYWVVEIPDVGFWIVKTKTLIDNLLENASNYRSVAAGDYARCILMPKADFKKLFTKL